MNTFTLYLEPILDPITKSYIQIVTCSLKPPGPLENFVKHGSFSQLSRFKSYSSCIYYLQPSPYFGHVESLYTTSQDIPSILSFLENNGYVINTQYTQISKKYQNNIICILSYKAI
jgi:hypothetical protein